MAHVLADRPHLLQGGLDVELGTGQQVAQVAALGEGGAAQIDSGDHAPNCLRPAPRARSPVSVADTRPGTSLLTVGVHAVTQREERTARAGRPRRHGGDEQ